MGLTRREGDVEVARHLYSAGENLAAAVQAAMAGGYQKVEIAAISFSCKKANDTIQKLIDQELGGEDFLALWPPSEEPGAFNALWDALSEIVESGALKAVHAANTTRLHDKALDALMRAAAERQEAV